MTTTVEWRLRRRTEQELMREHRPPVTDEVLDGARRIVDDVRRRGSHAVREYAERFGERSPDAPLVLGRDAMREALETIDTGQRAVLERTARRIESFARLQREAIRDLDTAIPGGRAGHTIEPVVAAGCYAPAGRYPLPSSVLMTAVTARIAGCERVVVASPGAHPVILAASAIAGAATFLAVGGAHAIAALAYGMEGLERVDVIAGPGNAWVTAAKQLVTDVVGIDMLAGPSELLVLADESADPSIVAADLLAQAEHDADAVPMLVTTSSSLADAVDLELSVQGPRLATSSVAACALRNGFTCIVNDRTALQRVGDRMASEHVQIMVNDAEPFARSLRHAGALFIGQSSAEVLGDYGAGPNHTLPTGGTARFRAGLSVMHFLRVRTWMRIDNADAARPLVDDACALATMEGLAGHAAAAARRRPSITV